MANDTVSWQMPPFEADDAAKLGAVKRAIDRGIAWNREHLDQTSMQKAMDILSGKSGASITTKWSNIATGDLKRGVRDIIESLSDIRPFWGYSTENKAFLAQSDMMNKTVMSVYLESFVDRSINEALQFAAVTQCGFIYPYYSRDMFGAGDGEFCFMALGQPDVLPVQLPRNRDYQKAYAVTLAIPMGVAEAHARFPLFQQFLTPFAQKRYGKTKGGEARRSYDQDRWRMHSLDSQLEEYCDVYYTYVLDLRINHGEMDDKGNPILDDKGNPIGKVLYMGQRDTSWYYEVPFVGQTITRFENGRNVTRPATVEDCRVYPYRRLLISCDKALMYDGPAFDWHGMVPLIPFYLDKWAWGDANSLFDGTAPIQDAIDDLMRSVYRVAMGRVNPGKAYNADISAGDNKARLTTRQVEQMDVFDPNAVYAVDGDVGEQAVIRPPMPQWCYEVPEWVLKTIEVLQEAISKQLGLDQISALDQLRASIQDPEKLLEAEGPVVIGTSRSMEMGLRDLGEMMKFMVLQYMTTREVMQVVGIESIAPTTFDYDPEMIVPSHLPGEQTLDADQKPVASTVSRYDRARNFAKNIKFFITPHSLHYIAQNKYKLNLLAAQDKGVVVDPETMAKAFEVPNWGTIDGSTVKEKVFNWAKEKLEAQADIAALANTLGLGQGEPPPQSPGPQPGHGGRPNTYAQPPKLEQKGLASGGRVVVSTSG